MSLHDALLLFFMGLTAGLGPPALCALLAGLWAWTKEYRDE